MDFYLFGKKQIISIVGSDKYQSVELVFELKVDLSLKTIISLASELLTILLTIVGYYKYRIIIYNYIWKK
jgi:hypothetical protein